MITFENGFIYFSSDDQKAKKLDAIYIKSRKCWRLPDTIGALREMHRLGFNVAEYGKKKASINEKYKKLKSGLLGWSGYDERLRPYQDTDITYLIKLPHCGIFSEMRTGKTPTTLKLIEAEGHEKIIVICPASLVLNWTKEVKQWTSYNAFSVKGTKTKRSKTYQEWESKKGFLVLSKDTAKADVDLLEKYKDYALIVDEAHFLRNYQSQQSKAIYKLGKNTTKRLALTGIPSVNAGNDIYGILHFLYPERFSSYWQFVDRYFKVFDTPWNTREVSGYKRKEELQEILDLISVQRKRSEVMQWIPPKQYQTIEVEMDGRQRKAYNDMLETFTVEDNGEIKVDAPSVLAQLTRLRQICLSPDLLDIKAPSAKEQFILEWLEDNPNEQVIIFSNFTSYLSEHLDRILRKKGYNVDKITGRTTKDRRNYVVNAFQTGKIKVLLANIQAAGVGLTLDAASTVIFLDRAYTPTDNAQAEDRIVPTTESSNQNCTIIDVVCKDSIDQTINDILKKKKSVIEVVNNYRSIKDLVY